MARRLLVLLNPKAGRGRGRAVLSAAEPILREVDGALDVRTTEAPGHATELAASTEADLVVVVGGDGSVHEVVEGLMRRAPGERPVLGLLPAGSGNALGHDLRCLDPVHAALAIAEGATRPLDVMKVQWGERSLHAFNIVGWGLAADAGATAEALRLLGPGRYAIANLIEVLRRRVRRARLEIYVDEGAEELVEGDFAMVLACNTQHTARGLAIAPDADFGDGRIDLIEVAALPRGKLLSLLRRVKDGTHTHAPGVRARRVSSVTLTELTAHGMRLNVDGEIVDAVGAHEAAMLTISSSALQVSSG